MKNTHNWNLKHTYLADFHNFSSILYNIYFYTLTKFIIFATIYDIIIVKFIYEDLKVLIFKFIYLLI